MSGPWYWCLDHNEVEPEKGCPNDRRLGPYGSYADASRALARAEERTEKWDEQDAQWDDG